jgi:hypothetical protein
MITIPLGESLSAGQTKIICVVDIATHRKYINAASALGVKYTNKPYPNYGAGEMREITLEASHHELLKRCLNNTGDVFVVPVGI